MKNILSIALCIPMLIYTPIQSKEATRTKSGLKEDIGAQLKASIDECVSIQERLSQISAHTCKVQRQLITQMEDLLENGPTFKGKSKDELQKTLTTLTQTTEHLHQWVAQIDIKPAEKLIPQLT